MVYQCSEASIWIWGLSLVMEVTVGLIDEWVKEAKKELGRE